MQPSSEPSPSPNESPLALPRILEVESRRVRYREPRRRLVGLDLVEVTEGVEITIRTDGELPSRAESPVLVVGEREIARYAPEGPDRYRFIVYRTEDLQDGAPVALGWPGRPQTRVGTAFHYRPGGERPA